MIKKLEVLANIAVITTSLVVCTVLIRRYLLPSNRRAAVQSKGFRSPTQRLGALGIRCSFVDSLLKFRCTGNAQAAMPHRCLLLFSCLTWRFALC